MKNDLTDEQLRQEVTVVLPLGAVLRLGAVDTIQTPLTERATRYAFAQDVLPAIGEPFSNEKLEEIYAGITLHGNEAFALVLLPGDYEGNWQGALAWAEKQGGMLPSRFDALVLWQNLKGHFKKEAYWTSEQLAVDADWAWCQDFYDGYQYCYGKSGELRARAVRRVPL
jgi:hypothetical protein